MKKKIIWKKLDNSVPLDRKILMWREDSKNMVYDFPKSDYINHPEYAYTLWTEAPNTPTVDNSEQFNIYDEIPSDTEPRFDD